MSDFFQLKGTTPDVNEPDFIKLLVGSGPTVENLLYRPDTLSNPYPTGHLRVKGKTFRNVSFSKTIGDRLEFSDCEFVGCLFIATRFKNCRFTGCRFVASNPYRIEFDSVYLDPRSFQRCLERDKHQNIGVYLFQELLRNSRKESQPDFESEAMFLFRRWQRYNEAAENKDTTGTRHGLIQLKVLARLLYEVVLGSGVRLRNLVLTGFGMLALISIINWCWRVELGLLRGEEVLGSLVESLYFSTVVVTTLGFGDVTPTTPVGQVVIAIQAVAGFVFFALLASMIFRKFST